MTTNMNAVKTELDIFIYTLSNSVASCSTEQRPMTE
jgi:hypothetical protein